jgi:hypothetical protein
MRPLFAKRKGGRDYAYYAGPTFPSVGGGDDDTIHRVPAKALDGLVLRRLLPLIGDGSDRDDCRSVIARVEVGAAQVQIILRRQVLTALSGHRGGLQWLRARLGSTDRVISEAARPDRLRIEVPVRLKPRGGRTFAVGPNGEPHVGKLRPDAKAIRRLRSAHRVPGGAGLGPSGDVYALWRAAAPAAVARTKWAFLAPELQRAVLAGRLRGSALGRLDTVERVSDLPSTPPSLPAAEVCFQAP